jgi:hypothetical protein
MNKKLSLTTILTILLSLFLLVIPAFAQEGGFTETFDDTSLSGWIKIAGDTIVENGVLKMDPGSMVMKSGNWSDITLTVKFRFEESVFAVVNYYATEGQFYSLTVFTDTVFVEKIDRGEPSRLWETTTPPTLTTDWNTLVVQVSGTNHTITLNDIQLGTFTDSPGLSGGSIQLHVPEGNAVEFDEVILTGTAGEELPLGEGEPPPGEEPPQEGEPPPEGGEPAPPTTQDTSTTGGTDMTLTEEFFSSQASNLELTTLAINLLLAALSAFILSRVYIHWGSSLSNRRVFAANFMLLTVATTFIILVVRSSVALSLGLVGALSIVRFRAAVKEPEELAYLFFAIGLGIGFGDNQRLITLLTLLVAIIIVGLLKLFRNIQADVNLHLTIASSRSNPIDLDQIMGVLEKHCSKFKLLRFDQTADALESSFVIEFKRVSNLSQAKADLLALNPNLEISFLDNKGIW